MENAHIKTHTVLDTLLSAVSAAVCAAMLCAAAAYVLLDAPKHGAAICLAGVAAALLGYALRALGMAGAGHFAMTGYALLLGGWALGVRYVVCPHCGGSLSRFLRLPGDLPGRCPHCGERIEPPEE